MVDDDARLMLAFRDGDRRAFEALFSRYTPRILTFLTRLVRDRARAEELTQDVFVRIYNAADRYQASARFSTWIFGIAHNLALNELSRAHRRHERPATDLDLAGQVDPAPGVDDRLEADRKRQQIERALAKLPERQRAALLLRSEQGLDYSEIALALETTVPSVKSLIHRARETLLAELGSETSP
ncbi:MAG: sigma-70 family RNA polymerase sigma factor [Deltaproteobacteria bacterium]|nr:sigma-70 family RNA polymerase sigma factor [Deltaproteobacteria bacterium]